MVHCWQSQSPSFTLYEDLRAETTADPTLVSLHQKLEVGELAAKLGYIDGLSTFNIRSMCWTLPPRCLLSWQPHRGHEGIQKTLHRLCRDFHVPRDRAVVEEYVRSCTICQRNKTEHLLLAGLVQPPQVPSQVWVDISMDFIEGLLGGSLLEGSTLHTACPPIHCCSCSTCLLHRDCPSTWPT